MIPASDYRRDRNIVRSRITLAATGVVLLAAILVARLAYIQISQHQRFSTLAQNNRIDFTPVAPLRGLIYDRNGKLLAENRRVYNLEILPDQIDDINRLLNELGQLVELTEEDVTRFKALLRRRPSFERQTLRTDLNEEEAARIALHQHRYPGVELQARLQRHYPYGESTAHLIGYVGRINADDLKTIDPRAYRGLQYLGRSGIEAQYEQALRGRPGIERVETNAHGKVARSLGKTAPGTGLTVHLSLDIELQRKSMEALRGYEGAVVAIAPDSGEVLALASAPGFDPNPFVNGISKSDYARLLDSEEKSLLNRALYGRYAPGSTIKGFMLLVGLRHGVDPAMRRFCPGWYSLPRRAHRYRDWKRGGHGSVDGYDSIVQSCDVYFYQLARRLGIERIHDGMARFGFGERTGIDLPGEPSGLMPSPQWKHAARGQAWYPGETVITGIGQGYMLVTPLQLAAATAMLANRGQPVTPRFLVALENPQNQVRRKVAPPPRKPQAARGEYYDYVINSMRDVVHGRKGTARAINKGLRYEMAGKTGTAQVKSIPQNVPNQRDAQTTVEKKFEDHSLFIAFAPLNNPKIAIAVIAEHAGSGSATAAPIARELIDFYLQEQLGLFVEGGAANLNSPDEKLTTIQQQTNNNLAIHNNLVILER